jgi:hypothetical protein
MIGIGQFTPEKIEFGGLAVFPNCSKASKTVSKTPHDFFDQFQLLEELYQELLALRVRVRRAERAREKRANVDPKSKAGHRTGRKQVANRRAR